MELKLQAPGIKIGNASDEDISVTFDSAEKFFPAGEIVELAGHSDFARTKGGAIIFTQSKAIDAFGRAMPNTGTPIPKEGAGPVEIAQFCLKEKGSFGLYHVTGNDKVDEAARKEAAALGKRTRIAVYEKTMSEWRQKCHIIAAQGGMIPPQPENVVRADTYLVKNAAEAKKSVKRFQVKLDGASYDTWAEAKKHIFDRPSYAEHRENWKAQVADRFGDDELVEDSEELESKPEKPAKKK